MFGDDEPRKPQQPVFRHQSGYTYHYQQQGGGGYDGAQSPFSSMLPFVATLMFASFLFLFMGAILVESIDKTQLAKADWKSKKGPPEPPFPVQLTRTNADVTCGATEKPLCVILLTDPSKRFGDREAVSEPRKSQSVCFSSAQATTSSARSRPKPWRPSPSTSARSASCLAPSQGLVFHHCRCEQVRHLAF